MATRVTRECPVCKVPFCRTLRSSLVYCSAKCSQSLTQQRRTEKAKQNHRSKAEISCLNCGVPFCTVFKTSNRCKIKFCSDKCKFKCWTQKHYKEYSALKRKYALSEKAKITIQKYNLTEKAEESRLKKLEKNRSEFPPDSYIKSLLVQGTCLSHSDIPDSLIVAKRAHLRLYRDLKQEK